MQLACWASVGPATQMGWTVSQTAGGTGYVGSPLELTAWESPETATQGPEFTDSVQEGTGRNSPGDLPNYTSCRPVLRDIPRAVPITWVNFMSIIQVASSTVKQMECQVHGLSWPKSDQCSVICFLVSNRPTDGNGLACEPVFGPGVVMRSIITSGTTNSHRRDA